MARTRGGSVSSRGASTSTPIGENERGKPIPPQQQPEVLTPRTENLGLSWKENTLVEEAPSRAGNDDQNQHHDMDVPPTSDNIGKNPNPLSTSDAKVGNAETLGGSIRDRDGSYHDPQGVETVKPTVNDDDSSKKNLDNDDVVVVYETTSRRRARASVVALKTKREADGLEEERSKSGDPIDLEELESVNKKKKAVEKGKGKRPCFEKPKGESVPKKEKGINISEPTQGKAKDKFVVDDAEDFEEDDAVYLAKSKSKGKMKLNDDRNRINNRRIAKGIDEVSTEEDYV
ncbi:hypothetical protein LIER_42218 [Lithospermum erythrorhizon]|uniref:Uncharacterized protein n=1 Tax=Lithospermum erythrorhizon TaxID=34254 RepID=A0AAV3RL40_LITER